MRRIDMVRYTLFEIFGKKVGKGWWPFFKKAPNWRHCRRLVSFFICIGDLAVKDFDDLHCILRGDARPRGGHHVKRVLSGKEVRHVVQDGVAYIVGMALQPQADLVPFSRKLLEGVGVIEVYCQDVRVEECVRGDVRHLPGKAAVPPQCAHPVEALQFP